MKCPRKKASLAAVLLAGSLALTGCTAQHMPTVPTAQTQSAPLKIEVVGEAEMYLLPGAALKGKPAIHNVGSMDVYCFMQIEMPVFPSETVDLEADEPAADPISLLCSASQFPMLGHWWSRPKRTVCTQRFMLMGPPCACIPARPRTTFSQNGVSRISGFVTDCAATTPTES